MRFLIVALILSTSGGALAAKSKRQKNNDRERAPTFEQNQAKKAEAKTLENVSREEAEMLLRSLERQNKTLVNSTAVAGHNSLWDRLDFSGKRRVKSVVKLRSNATKLDSRDNTLHLTTIIETKYTMLGNEFRVIKDLNIRYDPATRTLTAGFNNEYPSGAKYNAVVANNVQSKSSGKLNIDGLNRSGDGSVRNSSTVKSILLTDIPGKIYPYVTLKRLNSGLLLWAGTRLISNPRKDSRPVVIRGKQVSFDLGGSTDGQTKASVSGNTKSSQQVRTGMVTTNVDADVRAGITYHQAGVEERVSKRQAFVSRFARRISPVYLDTRPSTTIHISSTDEDIVTHISKQKYKRAYTPRRAVANSFRVNYFKNKKGRPIAGRK